MRKEYFENHIFNVNKVNFEIYKKVKEEEKLINSCSCNAL